MRRAQHAQAANIGVNALERTLAIPDAQYINYVQVGGIGSQVTVSIAATWTPVSKN